MIDSKVILEDLRKEWQASSQEEISRRSGVSRTYLCELLSGKADANGLSIKKINALFPHARIDLHGNSFSVQTNGHSVNVFGSENFDISSSCLNSVIEKILDSEELSDSEKIKVIKVLKK